MNGYSEDLRRKIVSAVERGVSKSQAARLFGVSLSSVKRYAGKADRGESLAPKKSPGSTPGLDEKARKLLEDDLRLLPFTTLEDRREYVRATTGISVNRSTVCRTIAGIGSTREKGASRNRARRVLKGGLADDMVVWAVDPDRLVFVDDSGRWGCYLAGSDLRLCAERRAPEASGT